MRSVARLWPMLLGGCCFIVAPVSLAEKLYVQAPAIYDAGASVSPKIREECGIEAMVAQHVQRQLKRSPYQPILPLADLSEAGASKALSLTIVRVVGVGGGAWSGAKGIDVRATLFENGKAVDSYAIYKGSRGGAFGAMKSTCSILDRSAAAIGANIARWLSQSARSTVAPSASEAEVDSGDDAVESETTDSK